jgi:hypothetical protein
MEHKKATEKKNKKGGEANGKVDEIAISTFTPIRVESKDELTQEILIKIRNSCDVWVSLAYSEKLDEGRGGSVPPLRVGSHCVPAYGTGLLTVKPHADALLTEDVMTWKHERFFEVFLTNGT